MRVPQKYGWFTRLAERHQVQGNHTARWIMMQILFLFVFLSLVCIVSSTPDATQNSYPWDFFLFAEQSAGGTCYLKKGQNCSYASNITNWTMHGIWATLNGTQGPNWCRPNATFSLDKIQELLPQMVRQWPNIFTNTTFDSFWSHEWLKHGTCASQIRRMRWERGFFSTALDLHNTQMNFTTVLHNHGILPSHDHTFKTVDFNLAFMTQLGVSPILECHYLEGTGQVLYQISLCLGKDFTVMSCPDYLFKTTSHRCQDNEEVHYIPNF